jgi:hypothetical protein
VTDWTGALAGSRSEGGVRPHGGRAQASARRKAVRAVSARARARACCAVALGALILALAVPRTLAAFWLWLRAPVMDLVIYQEPVSKTDLYGLIASRELALGWIDGSEANGDLAAALTVLASFERPEGEKERELLRRATAATEAGLARAPADPRGWTRLAYLRTLRAAAPDPRAAQALALSLATGRYDEADFLALRLHLMLLQGPLLPASARAEIGDQSRLLWQEAPGQLVELALEPGFPDIILAALADAPAVRSQLLDAMRGVILAK